MENQQNHGVLSQPSSDTPDTLVRYASVWRVPEERERDVVTNDNSWPSQLSFTYFTQE